MKPIHFWLVAGTVVASLSLAACEDDPGYYHHHRGLAAYDGGYDIYYDDYYGPVYDGYWGGDGWFYYRSGRDRPFVRDEQRHFRRDHADGYHSSHMHDWRDRHDDDRHGGDRR